MIFGILVGVILLITFMGVGIYNGIIGSKNSVEESIAAIDAIFQNRYDLIPNLVQVVKEYTDYEGNTLKDIIEIRTNAMKGEEVTKEKLQQENMISGALKSIFALSENYPNLKASEQFLNLQNQWQEIEDRLQAARRSYNSSVKVLQDKKEQIPSNFIAASMNLKNYDMFEAEETAKKSLDAKELFNS